MIVSLETEFWEELENCVQPKYTKWHRHYRMCITGTSGTPHIAHLAKS